MPDAHTLAAALVAPWTAWAPTAPDELALIGLVEAFGPLPQADLLAPWEPDEPWTARVLRPPLDRAAELLVHGELHATDAPGRLEWEDRGRTLEEHRHHGRFCFRAVSDAEDGGWLTPERIDGPPAALQDALREHTSPAATAHLVVHPTTGRPGVHLDVVVPDQEPELERRVVLDALADLLDAHTPTLAPTVVLWFTFQHVHAVAWFVAPARRPLPAVPLELPRVALADWPGARELQVHVPAADHDRSVLAIADSLGTAGWIGDRTRWIGDRFVATWTHAEADVAPDLPHPGRFVPGCPPGLEADWVGIDPEIWAAGDRFVVRLHCGLRDRDLLPVLRPRDHDAVDHALAERLGSLARIDPVDAGLPGVRLRFPNLDGAAWEAVVEAIGHLPVAAIGPVAFVRMVPSFTVILVRTDLPAEIPTWSAA